MYLPVDFANLEHRQLSIHSCCLQRTMLGCINKTPQAGHWRPCGFYDHLHSVIIGVTSMQGYQQAGGDRRQ